MTSTTTTTNLATSPAVVMSASASWHSITAGFIAGCVTRTTTSPMDVIKIIYQVKNQKPMSIRQTCRSLYRTRGIRGFWTGNLAGCCRLGPYSGVKFYLYDSLQRCVSTPDAAPSNIERAVCGSLAGMAATLAVYPMELVRTRLIVSKQSSAIRGELLNIFRNDGIRGLFRGCLTGLVGAIPFEGIQFACYEYGKTYSIQHRWLLRQWPAEKTQLQTQDHLILGSASGAVAQMVAYPFDTIKKRLQMQPAGSSAFQYKGFTDCFYKILRDEGSMALYRGSVPNMIRLVPYAAVMFASYEAAKDFLTSL